MNPLSAGICIISDRINQRTIGINSALDVTFELNGGEWEDGSTEKTITVFYNQTYPELPTPVKEGYDFEGWFTDSAFTNESAVSEGSSVKESSDHILYAKWSQTRYTLTANPGLNTVFSVKTFSSSQK